MNIIYKKQRGGKTTQLLELASKQEGYNLVVCNSHQDVKRLWGIILEKKYGLPQPITFYDFIKRNYCGRNIENIYIDNADILLQFMCDSTKIGGITITKYDD